ncbi:MAG: mechanosensitive ion channel [Campylobacterota bacterium]|nr:mechanosensitive ion channel [Campylobacterota bacterium]
MKNFVKLVFLLFFILSGSVFAKDEKKPIDKDKQYNLLKNQLDDINEDLEGNIWITRYNNYLTYRKIETELAKIKKDAKKYGNWKGDQWKELSYQLTNKIKIKENELELISEYKDSPIGKQIKPSDIPKPPVVTNPISIIEAWTYAQSLEENMENYQDIKDELTQLLEKIKKKIKLLTDLNKIKKDDQYKEELEKLKRELKDFIMVVEIVSTTDEVYNKKIAQIIQELKDSVAAEIGRSIKIAAIIALLFLLSVGVKIATKKYIEDDDRYYTTNKLINFIFIVIIVFVLLFSYIENVSYLVTILGFASAGIAIALKDWFMSIFGWMAIMTSGAITVGDRIKVVREGIEVVGDVLDISLFKISVREDVTLTSYTTNRRSGRVFFIPNNYIFTDLISNYTFDNLRTVWDGIDIYITFDSNHKKAKELARSILETHSKGYTDLTRKRLQKMRKKYVLRSSNPDPRVFSFIEPYGIVVSCWYYTNSHATLALRSTISMEILEAFKAADDIYIAYPTQTLRVSNNAQTEAESLLPGSSSTGLFDPPVTT